MAHIEKRDPGRWRARYRGPDNRERSRTFERRVDAQRWLDGARGDLARGDYIDPAEARRVTFGEYARRWAAAQPWRQSTQETTAAVVRRILPAFGDRPIGSLRASEIQAWAAGLEARLAPATVEGTVRLVAAVLKAAEVDRLIPRSPADGVRLRRREGAMLVPLTVDEVRALAAAAPPELEAAVVLAATTGVRQGELFGLSADRVAWLKREVVVDRVAWLKREVVVDRQLVTPTRGTPRFGPCKTSRSVRTVPVADHALETLGRHVELYGSGEGGLVFHRAIGARGLAAGRPRRSGG